MNRILRLTIVTLCAAACAWAQTTHKSSKASNTSHRPAARHSLLNPASLNDKAPETYKAKFTTTKGDFVVEITRGWAPLGADRFYNLVKYHFYDDASIFRVVPGFVVQFGIPAKPAVSKVWARANMKDEPVTQKNLPGYLTYAKTAMPNTRSTQIFINLQDNSEGLDRQGFAPFGHVVEGMEVIGKFYGGYGDNGPDQERLTNEGKAYVDQNFPQLDIIKTAVIVGQPTPAAHHPSSSAHPKSAANKAANRNAR